MTTAGSYRLFCIEQPPPTFLATMEEYVKEAPQSGSVPRKLVRNFVRSSLLLIEMVEDFFSSDNCILNWPSLYSNVLK